METAHQGDILVVDDLLENLHLLGDVLQAAGYKVRLANSGKLALRAAENQAPDLIMLDITMPEMDGFEVCRRLKEHPDLQHIPVIFISALTETLDKVRAFNAGGVDYVTKPFEPKEVLSRVKAHCGLRRAQMEVQDKNAALENALDELKKTQVQLVRSEKMASLGVLTAGLAHEINNPVNFVSSGVKGLVNVQEDILGLLDAYRRLDWEKEAMPGQRIAALQEEYEYADARQALEELMDSIQSGVKRTVDIVEALRIYSRADDQSKTPTDINENIKSALRLLQHRMKRLDIKVETIYAQLPTVYCFGGHMNQVFMNVLGNALDAVIEKHGDAGGCLKVATVPVQRDNREGIEITIADNGSGMSDDIVEHIFDPFFTTKKIGQGVGLGLSISYGIIEDHQGTITVDSSPDTGTVFTIWMPCLVQERQEVPS